MMAMRLFPSRKNVVSTGVEDLDLILEGGYPQPGAVLLLGEPSREKLALFLHFIASSAKAGRKPVFVTTDFSPSTIKAKAREYGVPWPYESIQLIDAYSRSAGLVVHDRNVMPVDGPGALNDISLALRQLRVNGAGKEVGFYSVSTMVSRVGERAVLEFVRTIISRINGEGGTVLLAVNEGMHTKAFVSALESGCDLRLSLKKDAKGDMYLFCSSIDDRFPVRVQGGGFEIL